jgi:hypothetical protein
LAISSSTINASTEFAHAQARRVWHLLGGAFALPGHRDQLLLREAARRLLELELFVVELEVHAVRRGQLTR